jgi:cyclophilin family peptidyl-prolyl cis-trans isomerase
MTSHIRLSLRLSFSLTVALLGLWLATPLAAQRQHDLVRLETTEGPIVILLLTHTELHRANFVRLASSGFFDSTFFHRIIDGFVVQGGDPSTKHPDSLRLGRIGSGGPGYTVPAELHPGYIHRLGAVGAARLGDDVNPTRASSGSQFYLVEGRAYTPGALDTLERQRFSRAWFAGPQGRRYTGLNFDSLYTADPTAVRTRYAQLHRMVDSAFAAAPEARFTPAQRAAYTTVGGTPQLDGQYTVFGYVVEGLEVMRALSATPTDAADRPRQPHTIRRASAFRLSRRALEQRYGQLPMR